MLSDQNSESQIVEGDKRIEISKMNSPHLNGKGDIFVDLAETDSIEELSSQRTYRKGDFFQTDSSGEEPKANYEKRRLIMGKQEKQIRYTETKAGQIVVSYIFFVTIMYSSVTWSSSSSAVLRRVRWILFSQIIMISAIFWIAITTVIQRLLKAKYHYEESVVELEIANKEMDMVQSGQELRHGGYSVKPDPFVRRRWYAYVFAIVSPLIAFSVLTLYACVVIFRDERMSFP
ncbi:hypothetical protein Vadar_007268 [Vaccinium darrowii]|uniref:Uncharacterized protein n=1 Tax=Vaccinium darrowii TaxID=229202 RepID=A0ACB7XG51_9ERIC|nr:hypothetical protein Vadar_007268 [Vaccinium darrowii]